MRWIPKKLRERTPESNEQGAALVLTALALLVMVGVVGLALDGGQAYNTRRGTQNAADNAALAAAWAHCSNLPDPVAHGLAAAESNGYATGVTVTQVAPSAYDGEYNVVISTEEETSFARVMGVDEVTVVSEATAACARSLTGGPAAMFAKGPGPGCLLEKGGNADVTGFVYSAGDMIWNGGGSQWLESDVHSDANLTVNGTYNIQGVATAHGTSNKAPPVMTGVPKLNLEYPVNFQVSDFIPGSAVALEAGNQYHEHTGNVRGSDIRNAGPGIHFVQGNVTHQGPGLTGGPYTIVATGTITLNSPQFDAYHEGLAMLAGAFSPPSCFDSSIDLGGSSNISGILFAPNGKLEVNGGAVNGGMIAWAIDTSGNLDLHVNPDLFPTGDPRVFLLD